MREVDGAFLDSSEIICGKFPAKHFTIIKNTQDGKRIVSESILAVWGARVYLATYSYPVAMKPSPPAMSSLRSVCPSTI